jgi:hypothetical protein
MSRANIGWTRSGFAHSLLALTVLAGPAWAEPEKTDLLGGPKVKDAGVPGENRRFTEGQGSGRDRAREIPHRLFMQSLDVLRGESAGEIKLTGEQEDQIKTIDREFADSVRAYREEKKDEFRQLRETLPPAERRRLDEFARAPGADRPQGERRGRGPDKDGPEDAMSAKPSKENAEAARQKLKEMIEGAPKPADAHAKIFGVLTQAQKDAVTKRFGKIREDMESRRDEMRARAMVEKRLKDRDAEEAKEGSPRERMEALLASIPREERQQIREKLRDMSPEERRAYLQELQAKYAPKK